MKQKLVASRKMRYGTRRLLPGDVFEAPKRDAHILTKLKRAQPYVRPAAEIPPIPETVKARAATVAPQSKAPEPESTEDPRVALRAAYQEKTGKRAFHGWDAETLRAKIAEGQAES